jgi:hypothetical protein
LGVRFILRLAGIYGLAASPSATFKPSGLDEIFRKIWNFLPEA